MSIKTKANLTTDTGTAINDNTTRDITPADVRGAIVDLIDSSINRIDDKPLLNLREYNTARSYEVGEGSIKLGVIYQCTTATTGTFNPAHWSAIIGPETLALNALSDVTITSPVNGQVLTYQSGVWVNQTPASSGINSLNGLTASSQTFVNDTNITIVSSSSTHTITWAGILAATRGGTGFGSYTIGDLLFASSSTALTKLGIGSSGQVLTVVGGVPAWQTPSSGGITTLNTLTATTQTFATGTAGTDFAISSATSIHTFNLPIASATNTGKLSSTDWSTFNNKFTLPALTAGSVLFSNGTTISQDNSNFFWDDTNNRLGIGTSTPSTSLHIYKTATNIDFALLTIQADGSSTSGAHLKLQNSGSGGATFDLIAAGTGYNSPGGFGILRNSSAYVLNSNSNGDWVIGANSPELGRRLKIVADSTSTNYGILIYNNAETQHNLSVRNDGRVRMQNLPTSAAGLSSGDLWNNSGVVNIV